VFLGLWLFLMGCFCFVFWLGCVRGLFFVFGGRGMGFLGNVLVFLFWVYFFRWVGG